MSSNTRAWTRWLHLKDPITITTVNDKVYIHIHKRLTLVCIGIGIVGLYGVGLGMMTAVIQASPAMFQVNRSLSACIDFENKVRHAYAGKVEDASAEIEQLKQINSQLVYMIQSIPDQPYYTPTKQRVALERPTKNVGGYP